MGKPKVNLEIMTSALKGVAFLIIAIAIIYALLKMGGTDLFSTQNITTFLTGIAIIVVTGIALWRIDDPLISLIVVILALSAIAILLINPLGILYDWIFPPVTPSEDVIVELKTKIYTNYANIGEIFMIGASDVNKCADAARARGNEDYILFVYSDIIKVHEGSREFSEADKWGMWTTGLYPLVLSYNDKVYTVFLKCELKKFNIGYFNLDPKAECYGVTYDLMRNYYHVPLYHAQCIESKLPDDAA